MRTLKEIKRLLNEDHVRDEEHEEEVQMVLANLRQMIAHAKELHDLMVDVDDAEEWVQEKIAVAAHDLESILGYVKFYEELDHDEEEHESMEDEMGDEEEEESMEDMDDEEGEGDEEVEAEVEVGEEEEGEEEMPVAEKSKVEATKVLAEAFSYRLRSRVRR